MAIIIPFADPDAHGSIAGSVTFRRRRGKVVFQKKPHGKQPNTPAQQAQKEKFADGWKAYHQLNPWEIEYLTNKAVELGTTKANLFLSQYLTDEIPSTVPLNLIKTVLSLSLPEPISDITEGLLHEFKIQIDSPLAQALVAHIYDNENVPTIGATASPHNRTILRIEILDTNPIVIPFNYPLIMDYTSQSDVDNTQLIRLPEISLPYDGVASIVKWTNLKSVQSFTILNTQQAGVADVQIELRQTISGTTHLRIISAVDDNRNESKEFVPSVTGTDTYIEFADNKGSPLTTTAGFQIAIAWTDTSDDVHNDVITFPAVVDADGGAPSAVGSNDVRDISNAYINYPQGSSPTALNWLFQAAGAGAHTGFQFGAIKDDQNTWIDVGPASDYTVLALTITNNEVFEVTLDEGYTIVITFQNSSGHLSMKSIRLPQLVVPASGSKQVFFSADYSVYDEVGLSTLLLKGYINTKKLWIADNFTLYYDQALTQLAKLPTETVKEIYLASDFSTYFDEALTQLGNTPFY